MRSRADIEKQIEQLALDDSNDAEIMGLVMIVAELLEEREALLKADYDGANDSRFSLQECEEAVNKTAILVVTGEITAARESCSGPYVMFSPHPRWGLGEMNFGFDLDALTVEVDEDA